MSCRNLLHRNRFPLSVSTFASQMAENVVKEFVGGKKLRVSTDYFLFFPCFYVREVSEITQQLQYSLGTVCTIDKSHKLWDARLGRIVLILHLLPGIVVDVWSIGRAQSAIARVADTRQGAIFHQMGNISFVADMYLVVGIGYRGIHICWVFQFYYENRYSIDE